MTNKADDLHRNAENCAELAAAANDQRDRRRYVRMEEAWKSLAQTQAWLDGEDNAKPA